MTLRPKFDRKQVKQLEKIIQEVQEKIDGRKYMNHCLGIDGVMNKPYIPFEYNYGFILLTSVPDYYPEFDYLEAYKQTF